jgi:hypothetical protein
MVGRTLPAPTNTYNKDPFAHFAQSFAQVRRSSGAAAAAARPMAGH